MRIAIALILLFSLTNNNTANAQKASIKWGPVQKVENSDGKVNALGWYEDDFYVSRVKRSDMGMQRNSYYIEKTNQNLTIDFTKKLDRKDYRSAYMVLHAGKIYAFEINQGRVNKESIWEVGYDTYDLRGKWLGYQVVKEIKCNKESFYLPIMPAQISASKNKKFIGIGVIDNDFDKGKMTLHNLLLPLDQLENPIYSSIDIALSEKVKETRISDLIVSDDGRVISTIGERETEYKPGTLQNLDPFLFKMVSVDKAGTYAEVKELLFDGVYMDRIDIKLINSEFFMSGMLLIRDGNKERSIGFFLAKVDPVKNDFINIQSFPYEEEFFESLGYKIKNNGSIKFDGYFSLKLVAREGGGFLLADHTESATYSHITHELIAFPFDQEGKLGNLSVLPKHQDASSKHINGGGYFAFTKKNDLYLVYNDHKKNLEVTDINEVEEMSGMDNNSTITILAKITEDGSIQRQAIANYKEDDGYLVTEKCFEEDGQILLNLADGKKAKYGKLKVE